MSTIAQFPLDPPCPVHGDIIGLAEKSFEPTVVVAEMADGKPAYQLDRLDVVTRTIRKEITNRGRGKRHAVEADWRVQLDDELGEPPDDKEQEERARQEKAAALAKLAKGRFSVLVDSSGNG